MGVTDYVKYVFDTQLREYPFDSVNKILCFLREDLGDVFFFS